MTTSLDQPPALPVRHATRCPDAEQRISRAALAATARHITAPVSGWHIENGEAVQRINYRTLLRHPGDAAAPFAALILCAQGAEHAFRIGDGNDLAGALRSTAACTTPHADLHGLHKPVPPTAWALYGRRIAVRTLQDAKGGSR